MPPQVGQVTGEEPFLAPDDPDACLELRCLTVEAYVCHGATADRIWED